MGSSDVFMLKGLIVTEYIVSLSPPSYGRLWTLNTSSSKCYIGGTPITITAIGALAVGKAEILFKVGPDSKKFGNH